MEQPPIIQPMPRPGPAYDPMDRIVQDLQNIGSFLSRLEMDPQDLAYLDSHLGPILGLRRAISQQLEKLSEPPYDYTAERLKRLHRENEQVFSYVEGMAGAMNPWNEQELNLSRLKAGDSG